MRESNKEWIKNTTVEAEELVCHKCGGDIIIEHCSNWHNDLASYLESQLNIDIIKTKGVLKTQQDLLAFFKEQEDWEAVTNIEYLINYYTADISKLKSYLKEMGKQHYSTKTL